VADLLVYSEKVDIARELLAGGRQLAAALGLGVSAAALGPGATALAPDLGAAGADRVFVSEDEALGGWPTDAVASGLAQIAVEADAQVVLLGSTRRGKETAPRLAQKLGAGCITDVNSLVMEGDSLIAGRYAFGGATLAREKLLTPIQVLAIMPKTFAADGGAAGVGTILTPALQVSTEVKVVERRPKEGAVVNLDGAPRIVGVGRGFANRDDLAMADRLAAALDAVVGCTKSIADFQWLSEDHIIGLSGAKTSPDLYLA
jgi:electron transfer flavoprotein alpha subunit